MNAQQQKQTVYQDASQRDASLLNEMLDKEVTFTPFCAKESIKLSARLVLRFLCTPTKSGAVCDERQAMKFIMLCKARGLNPWEGDAYIIGYDGQDGPQFSLITAHQAFLKRAEVHPEYNGMESGVIVRDASGSFVDRVGDLALDDDVLLGGWATVHFKSREHPMRRRLKLGTFSTGRSRWKVDPAGMIVKCAEADALRSAFPNSLGGMYLEGEFQQIEAETSDVKPAAKLPTGRIDMVRNGSNGSRSTVQEQAEHLPANGTAASEQPDRQPGDDGDDDVSGRTDFWDVLADRLQEAKSVMDVDRSAVTWAMQEPLYASLAIEDKQKIQNLAKARKEQIRKSRDAAFTG